MTSLVKPDGRRERHLTAREFHQIAGRAGRAGFDEVGWVVVQAPEHVIENHQMELRAGDEPKKRKKIVRKKLEEGRIGWTESTFERLETARPEALRSQFEITHAMVLNVLANPHSPTEHLLRLATDNHDPDYESNPHLRRLGQIYTSLRQAGVIDRCLRRRLAAVLTGCNSFVICPMILRRTSRCHLALAALELLIRVRSFALTQFRG